MPKRQPCPDRCNVLLVGGGGREHALAWRLRQSPRLGELWLTDQDNAGLASLGRKMDEPFDLHNVFRTARWCDRAAIDFVVVGPEEPLAQGAADALRTETRAVFGPGKAGAMLEADKAYAKELMRSAAIPTADARIFTDLSAAVNYAASRDEGMVVKAAGLAAGKGVVVCDSPDETVAAIERFMESREFGDAGDTILVEERLEGQEVSILALTDGRNNVHILPAAQDHKQRDEGDAGPNTGGMGAYSPALVIDEATESIIERSIIVPIVDALKRDGVDYRGVLYAGLMLTAAGPKVLEFNCRFGDPECQPLMARLRSDLIELLWATATGSLDTVNEIDFDPRTACTVVMCSEGYPGPYTKGHVISGLEEAEAMDDVTVFHAGTKRNATGDIVTNGGRVLAVTALGDDLAAAQRAANAACDLIHFDCAFFRRDIGHRALVHSSA